MDSGEPPPQNPLSDRKASNRRTRVKCGGKGKRVLTLRDLSISLHFFGSSLYLFTFGSLSRLDKDYVLCPKANVVGMGSPLTSSLLVEGLYRLKLNQNELLDRQERTIQHLIHNLVEQAFPALIVRGIRVVVTILGFFS